MSLLARWEVDDREGERQLIGILDRLHPIARRKGGFALQSLYEHRELTLSGKIERFDHIRASVRRGRALTVDDVKMKVRGERRAAIAQQSDELAGPYPLSCFDPNASRLEVRVYGLQPPSIPITTWFPASFENGRSVGMVPGN